jgi:AraC family ethanolamine operon transcriptional activator
MLVTNHAHYEDIDQLGLAFRGQNWNVQGNQLSRGKFQAEMTAIDTGRVRLLKIHVNCMIHAIGEKPPHSRVFTLPLESSGPSATAHCVPVQSNCIFGFDDQREGNLVTPQSGYDLGFIVVQQDLFQHYAEVLGRCDLDDAFMKRNIVQIAPNRFTPLAYYLKEVFHVGQYYPDFFKSSHVPELLEKDLLPLLVYTLPDQSDPAVLCSYRRAEIVFAAQEFMYSNLEQPLTLDDVCRAIHSSRRTLASGFQDIFSMGPMTFLKILRLNGVRRELLAADPDCQTVADIARSWGFWSLGHFSRDYAAMFNEYPSETLHTRAHSDLI